jgi:hypothetical protein
MARFAEGKIEAYVAPPERGAADDLEQVIVEFIAGAKTRLDIAVQEIDSRAIAQAILDARWRGVKVIVFLEQDYLRTDLTGTPPKPPTPRPGETAAERCGGSSVLFAPDLEIVKQLLKGIRECYSVPVHDRAAVRGGPGVKGPLVDWPSSQVLIGGPRWRASSWTTSPRCIRAHRRQ